MILKYKTNYSEEELNSFSDEILIKIIKYHSYTKTSITKELKKDLKGYILRRQKDRYTKGDCFKHV